jgi:uncharacterized protein YndB with AHSA1/START domain
MMTKTKTSIDHQTLTITFQRAFDAPREDVFEAWTEPEQITQWWDPTGTPLAACAVDLRPGGAFAFTMASGHAPPFAGVYRLVERPAQLVFDAMGSVGTVRLDEGQGATRMVVTIRCPSAEHLAQFLKLGVDVGTDKTLDNLVGHVAARQKAAVAAGR